MFLFKERSIDFNDRDEIITITKDLIECHSECYENFDCVAYAFNVGDNYCFKKTNNALQISCDPSLICGQVKGQYLENLYYYIFLYGLRFF
jgi:hypothetical protein